MTTVLTEENGKTRLNATSKYPSKEVRDMVLSTGMEKGAGISYDRLDEVARVTRSVSVRSFGRADREVGAARSRNGYNRSCE